MYRLLGFIPIWLGFICIKAPTWVCGLVVVPFIYPYRETEYVDLPWWTRPWSNPEDHKGGHASYSQSLPKWWIDSKGISFKSWYWYHALRNGANGLRSFEWLDLDIDPERVRYKTNLYRKRYEPRALRQAGIDNARTAWYLCWQGPRAGCKVVHIWNDERHLVMKLGWRVQPSDTTEEIDPNGLRVRDSGFASKLLVYRRG